MSDKNVFQRIIDREIPAEIVYENPYMIAIKDANPVAPIHILIISKLNVESLDDEEVHDGNNPFHLGSLLKRAAKIARDLGIAESGYRIVFNTNKDGGQTVPRLHLHLLAGRQLGDMG